MKIIVPLVLSNLNSKFAILICDFNLRRLFFSSQKRPFVMAEEAGAYEVFSGRIHSFSGLAVVAVVHAVYVVHGPADSICGVWSRSMRNEGFHAQSTGTDECQCGTQIRVIE